MIVIDEISASEHVVGFRSFALRLVICLKAVTEGWQWIFLFFLYVVSIFVGWDCSSFIFEREFYFSCLVVSLIFIFSLSSFVLFTFLLPWSRSVLGSSCRY